MILQVINKGRNQIKKLRRYYFEKIVKDDFRINIYKWKDINGDKTLRLDYPLDGHSIVFDLGGYIGDFSADIFCKFNSNIFIFEPIKKYSDIISTRFKFNPKIRVVTAGLSDKNQEANISISGNTSSLYKNPNSKNKMKIKLLSFFEFIEINQIRKIDLLKINIEGAEFDFMDLLINNKLLTIVRFYQIQFHSFIPNAYEKRQRIRNELKKYYKLQWEYPFVWESWGKK